MAARSFTANMFALQKDVVKLFVKGVGAGAADLTGVVGPGVASLKYNSATGKVKVTLQDTYNALLMVSAMVIDATTPDDWEVTVEAEAVATAATKTISLAVFKGGTLTDLTSDETLMLEITLRNTSQTK